MRCGGCGTEYSYTEINNYCINCGIKLPPVEKRITCEHLSFDCEDCSYCLGRDTWREGVIEK